MVYSEKLGDGSRFPTTVPLAELHTTDADLQALASARGDLTLPVRLGMSTDDEHITFYAAATGFVPGNVRVRQATYAPTTGNYSFTTDDSPPRTLIWTPIVHPGDPSTSSPITHLPTPDYSGPVVTPVDPYIEVFPSVAEGGFDDYIIVFPADSGLDPIYVMFKDRRNEPGVATGNGQVVTGAWLPQAATGQGAPIPASIAEKLRGRSFSSFDRLREAFWSEVAKNAALAAQFPSWQLELISDGLAAVAPVSEQVGRRKRYELHHVVHIANNGDVYNVDNLRLMTPKQHIELHNKRPGTLQ